MTFDANGLTSAGGRVSYNPNAKLSLSSGLDYTHADRRINATTELTYNPQKNLNFALSARADNKGSYWVGVGARLTF